MAVAIAAAAAVVHRPPAPDAWIYRMAEYLNASFDFQRAVHQHGPETTVLRGSTRGLDWSVAVRETQLGLCLILYEHHREGGGSAQSCGIEGRPFVAVRHGITRRLTATTFDETQHMVIGLAPAEAKVVRLRLGDRTFAPAVHGGRFPAFAQLIPCGAPNGIAEAIDSSGRVLHSFPLRGVSTGRACGRSD